MNATFWVIQHVPHEDLGSWTSILKKRNIHLRWIRPFRDETVPTAIKYADGLIVMGGPMGVYEQHRYRFLTRELRLIESALNQKIPTLGVCLGSQLLAEAAGGKVFPGHKKEIGWFHVELTHAGKKDKVFGGFPTRFEVFQWHGDTFRLPRHAVRLAQSQNYLNQAFRVGPCAWGLQFHMEMTASLIHSWLEQGKNEIRPLGGDHLRRSIVRRASGALPGMEKQAGQLLNNVFKVTRDMQQVTNNKE